MSSKRSAWIRFRSALTVLATQILIASVLFLPALQFDFRSKFPFTPLLLLLVQAALSAAVARLLRLERWWVLMSFFAPFLFLASLFVITDHWYYLLIFILSFTIYGATFRSRVPYFPSPDNITDLLTPVLPIASFKFLDVGSGFGKVLFPLASKMPSAYFRGIELAWMPFFISALFAKIGKHRNVEFVLGDFQHISFTEFDVVYTYLSPVVMQSVWAKALAEMRHGTLFISYEFNVDGRKADFEIQCVEEGTFLYVWKM
ncbi:class I SAM-dependent methyltransferase [Undibacterium luofuense]|uniref:Class I SAM-dependent methyltransferase n=1 Tax=Undibacterium luofuense TaxID=2828733 RepID=A0A941DQM1_9BURK|nr:class I SAM-dependent methyltransferase [Undibacterium luofuense]MBR7783066.1 class I SAM-dependent methyltransferase [Undibacterium luofuense]